MDSISIEKRGRNGFTLIELLVVIAIIGILASVVLASLNSARAKSRDARRLSDLTELRTALELYYTDNGSYPTASGWWGACAGRGGYATSGANGWIPNLAPQYIPVLPVDPKPTTNNGDCYIYNSDGKDYSILAYRTVEQAPNLAANRMPRPRSDGVPPATDGCSADDGYFPIFAIYSSGGRCW